MTEEALPRMTIAERNRDDEYFLDMTTFERPIEKDRRRKRPMEKGLPTEAYKILFEDTEADSYKTEHYEMIGDADPVDDVCNFEAFSLPKNNSLCTTTRPPDCVLMKQLGLK